jgi:hypothetical protein
MTGFQRRQVPVLFFLAEALAGMTGVPLAKAYG